MYKFECNQWTKIVQPSAEMLETRNLRIIFCNVDIKYFTSVLFNMRFEKWYSKRYLIEKKFKFGLTKLNGWTYIIGGYKDYRTDCSVDCFSVNEMKKVAKLNQGRYKFGAVALNGCIYAIGGSSGGIPLTSCEQYCPIEIAWTFIIPMLTPRYGHGVVTLNGQNYACGGRNSTNKNLNSCEVYDPEFYCWFQIAPMQTKRGSFSLVACNLKLYAIGGWVKGRTFKKVLSSVEEYDPRTNKWRFVEPLPDLYHKMSFTVAQQRDETAEKNSFLN